MFWGGLGCFHGPQMHKGGHLDLLGSAQFLVILFADTRTTVQLQDERRNRSIPRGPLRRILTEQQLLCAL